MVDVRPYSSPDLREGTSASHFYSSLPETPTKGSRSLRRPLKVFLVLLSGLLAFRLLVAIMTSTGLISTWDWAELLDQKPRYQVDVWLGVSKKEHGPPRLAAQRSSFPWSPHMLAWQRTAFHFQPEQNWMNGPLYYKEWYHLFYQYNPGGATWGSPIVWGHAISKDLIHWRHLPVAMSADKWYDKNGVWTGSATILPDGSIVMLYTGSTNETVQVLLGNPVLVPPPGIDKHDFRDPTTAWLTTEGKWRIIIGSKLNRSGISLVYDTKDFKYFELRGEWLHEVSGTGMWECVDFFPVSESEEIGLDTSAMGSGVKHVVKASFDDDRNDYYSIGTYDDQVAKWVPDNPRMDVGLGLRFDYGKFYASKTFYDPIRKRRVIWGWVPELDSVSTDVQRGWASLQSIPRTVSLDRKTGKNLLLWPVPEIEKLRLKSWEYKDVWVDSGSVVPLQVGGSSQLDIVAEFEINEEVLEKLDGLKMSMIARAAAASRNEVIWGRLASWFMRTMVSLS
ncbi:Beta-fructofuranosidase [Bertholletia excelsa]